MAARRATSTPLLSLLAFFTLAYAAERSSFQSDGPLLVVGSINVDTTVHLDSLPRRSETKIALRPSPTLAVGGKGANQAVAAALLSAGATRAPARFVCRLGEDAYLPWLQAELARAGLDTSASRVVANMSTGAGIVWLDAEGAATSVVLGGANAEGWSMLPPSDQEAQEGQAPSAAELAAREATLLAQHAAEVVAGGGSGSSALLLQREVPERVNEAFAAAAAAAGVPVFLDAGGDNSPLSRRLLAAVDFLAPNEQELQRLTGEPTASDEQVAAAAGRLMAAGARNVLVTLEARGSLLLLGEEVAEAQREAADAEGGNGRRCRPVRAIRQPALPVPGGVVVDATAAGDAFRAALAVALVEGRRGPGATAAAASGPDYEEALRFAAAAGAIAVSRIGAMPSLPTRAEVEQLLAQHASSAAADAWDAPDLLAAAAQAAAAASPASPATAAAASIAESDAAADALDGRSGTCSNPDPAAADPAADEAADEACPFRFGARLNSMKSRRDLLAASTPADGDSAAASELSALLQGNGPLAWVARQGLVAAAGGGGCSASGGGSAGLSVAYLNHPEHLRGFSLEQVQQALSAAGLRAGGVAMRFPADPFRAGAFTNPSAALRRAAVALAAEGCAWAAQLAAAEAGAAGGGGEAHGHLVVWSAYDGYDYHLQADYAAAWQASLDAFRELADACAKLGVAVSLEPKPTDPSSRFAFLPNTASALAFVRAVGRPNLGLTLDTGHMLMAGESLAQSVAEVAAAGKLFGLHLNDAHSRIGAEDGLVFGSVHAAAAQELVYYLRYKLPAHHAGPYSSGRLALPHAFFDTFPLNEDPVAEAATNVAAFRAMWARAGRLRRGGLEACLAAHDALCSLRLMARVA
ncbi:hypothetical protein HYH03_008151 [Edaphochlamys debaryana]|uniref:Ribokinase n=1 Tax=Edaphochlamys debaryana TaxID=47281 RepID=A0A835Y1M9_9CHLO|nr:hypothetical protein HYH03_008151 [Edaphochlamys debaryana]|eukprot:KAG2493634.1 hypothetical protein HYH03_008151 [Edaphochlamys debaryana]